MEDLTVQNRIDLAINALASCNTKTACIATWEKHLNGLKSHKTKENEPISHNTLRKAVSAIRKGLATKLNKNTARANKLHSWLLKEPIAVQEGKGASLGIVVAGKAVALENNKAKHASLLNNIASKSTIVGIDSLIRKAEQLLTSFDNNELIIAIALLTGRRTIEVAKTATFKAGKNGTLIISGLAKTKTDKAIIAPALCSPIKIIKAVKRLRAIFDVQHLDNEAFNKSYQVQLNRAVYRVTKSGEVKGFLAGHTEELATMHDLRKIYAAYCLKHVMGDGTITDTQGNNTTNARVFLQLIMGHDNHDTGIHYESWEV